MCGDKNRLTAGLVPAVALALAFLALAAVVRNGTLQASERALLLAFRAPGDPARGIGPVWLPETIRDVTGLGSTSVLATILVIASGYLAVARRWRSLVTLVATVTSAELLCLVLKIVFYRPRPDLIPDAPEVFTASFPSSHAMISVLTFFMLAALFAQVASERPARVFGFVVAACVTLMVGVSRIYLGVHWPTDVLGGWIAGLAWACLCWTIASRWCRLDRVNRPNKGVAPVSADVNERPAA